ncbi:MAG: 2Fe-2S iron-sulfur cluster-binding protein [Pyrinomonadaceae bacterium]
MSNTSPDLATYLSKFKEADWLAAIEEMLECIHEVDREAVQIWFRFYPLDLVRHIEASDDREATLLGFALKGDLGLKNQIDTSHHFLYGHRYWTTVKRKIEKEFDEFNGGEPDLTELIKNVSIRVAKKLTVERTLVNAIATVGLATLNQVGIDAFRAASGEVEKPTGVLSKSPDAVIAARKKDDSQGVFGFLKTIDKKFSVAFSGINSAGKFPVLAAEEIASASQKDRSHPWQEADERCWEGPVPIECTSAACGTCWVGVLGGREKLSDVAPRERRAMKVFGYNQPDDEKPFLRLACQAEAFGNVTVVIPPWNAVFGKKVRGNVEELELEPATTSAKVLRETIASAASGE